MLTSTANLGTRAAEIRRPILAQLAQLTPSSDDGQEGAASGANFDYDDVKIVAVKTDFTAFRNLKDRCYNCRLSTSPNHVRAVCNAINCKTFFGAPGNAGKNLQYVCNWCPQDYFARKSQSQLLFPVQTRLLCLLCHCSLSEEDSPGWCSLKSRRQFCNRCLGLQ